MGGRFILTPNNEEKMEAIYNSPGDPEDYRGYIDQLLQAAGKQVPYIEEVVHFFDV